MTIEIRITHEDGSYEQYAVAREPVTDPTAWTTVSWDNRGPELFTIKAPTTLRLFAFEGNRAETTTIIPVVEAFQAAHGIEELVIVAERRHALGYQPDSAGRGEAAVHRRRLHHPRPRRPEGPLPLGRGDLHRRPAHEHHHPPENSRSERDVRKRHESGQRDERVLHAPSRAVQHGERSVRWPQMSSARALRTAARRWVTTLSS